MTCLSTCEDKDHYDCVACGGHFEKGWSDDEAAQDAIETFGRMKKDEMALVCDDCFLEMGFKAMGFEA